MSASASKKKRKEQEQLGTNPQSVTAQKEQEKKKQTKRTILIFAAVIVVSAIALILLIGGLNAPSYDTSKAAVTVGDQSVSVPVYNYFYNTIANQYSSFVQPNIPLSQQSFFIGDSTMEDYFKDTTNGQLREILSIYGEAVKNGYKLSDDDLKSVSNALDQLKNDASSYGFPNVRKYLAARFGEGCNVDNYEEYLKLYLTYVGYYTKIQEDFQPTAEELSAEYQKDPSAYDMVTFTYAVTDAKGEKNEETNETTYSDEAKEEAKTEAEAKLEKMDEDTTTVTYNKSNATSMNEELSAWLFDTARKEGDTTVIAKNKDNTGYYTVRFDGRDDNNYKMVNAYVITITKDKEEVKEGQVSAEEKLDKLVEGYDSSMTDEAFETYIHEQGYETSVTRASKTTYDEDVTAFLFAEERKPGDLCQITTDSSYYVVRFASLDDETYQSVLCKNTLWSEFYNGIVEANELKVDDEMMKFANTDLTFYQNDSGSSSNADGKSAGDATPEDAAG